MNNTEETLRKMQEFDDALDARLVEALGQVGAGHLFDGFNGIKLALDNVRADREVFLRQRDSYSRAREKDLARISELEEELRVERLAHGKTRGTLNEAQGVLDSIRVLKRWLDNDA